MEQQIVLKFGPGAIGFFILLEAITVPLVAALNSIAIQNIAYMSIMGFIVAFGSVLLLLNLLKTLLLKQASRICGRDISKIGGLWYISGLAGILLMLMFFTQDLLYAYGSSDFVAGFFSALCSVFPTLLIYQVLSQTFNYGLTLTSGDKMWRLNFKLLDILVLTLLFSLYEFIVCPITSLWVGLNEYKVALAFLYGVLGGAAGGGTLYLISHFCPLQIKLSLSLLPNKP
jgi:hypothetical protein